MIAVALGSNQGDRYAAITRAVSLLVQRRILKAPLRFSSVYESKPLLPEKAKTEWSHLSFFNAVVLGETNLSPEALVRELKKIETDLGRTSSERWAPRPIDLDLIFYREEIRDSTDLKLPHPAWKERSFVVEPLRELGLSVTPVEDGLNCRALPLKALPVELVSIVNVTPDSFSDGGECLETDNFVHRICREAKAGASCIDIGAESTRPSAEALSEEEEWKRLRPRLEALSSIKRDFPHLRFSLDSRRAGVWRRAYEVFPFDFCNDVSAGEDSELLEFVRAKSLPYIFMHHLGIPVDKTRQLPVDAPASEQVLSWAVERLRELRGVLGENHPLIFDPGIGFGKSPFQSAEILSRIEAFQKLDLPLYVGHSRKSFLSLVTSKTFAERDLETAVLSADLSQRGVHYLRLHSVEASRRAIEAQFLGASQSLGLASA